MVKTKQTAKKSTGYPAPRMALLQSQTRFMRSRRVAQATKGKGRMVSNRERHSLTNNITLRMQTDVPSHVLTVEVRGPINLKADMDKDHDEWCSVCRNGGDCICCDSESCLRVVCRACVDFPKDPAVFTCPSCHLRLGKKRTPYTINGQPVILKGQGSTRESFLRTVSEPLAIVSITLQGLADDGPSRPSFEHLVPYLRGNACYINLDFNFGSLPEIHSFSERLETMVDLFESGQLQRFRRFFVFLVTHSDPERGDLHVTPGNQGSAATEQVFQRIFCNTRFGEHLKKSRDSVLALVSCGAVVSYPEPLNALLELSKQKYFDQILAFTQPSLQPTFANKFIQDYTINRFIHLKANFSSYIYDHQVLGAHTNLLIIDSGPKSTPGPSEVTGTFLFWSHDGQRPLGHACPQQCPSCYAIKPWTPKSYDDRVEHRCKNCGKTLVYSLKPDVTQLTPPGAKSVNSERGTWWMKVSRHLSQ